MTSPWAALMAPQPNADLRTPDDVDAYLASKNVRSRSHYHDGLGNVKVTAVDGPSVVVSLPVPRNTLSWIFVGQP